MSARKDEPAAFDDPAEDAAPHGSGGLFDRPDEWETTDPREQFLSADAGQSLRDEATTVRDGAKQWHDVREAFEEYIKRQHVAGETWQERYDTDMTSHRFTRETAVDQFGRTLGADRAAYRLWDDELTTALLTRRAVAFDADGHPAPPADHLRRLLSANRHVYDTLRRELSDDRGLAFARLSVLEPHAHGYAHIHDGLWISGHIEADALRPAIEEHVARVDIAKADHHGDEAVQVMQDPPRRRYDADPADVPPASPLPRELCKSLAGFQGDGYGAPALDADIGAKQFYALLWATGVQQWRPGERVFPRLVTASQELWGPSTIDADPTDAVETARPDPVEMTEARPRSIAYDPATIAEDEPA